MKRLRIFLPSNQVHQYFLLFIGVIITSFVIYLGMLLIGYLIFLRKQLHLFWVGITIVLALIVVMIIHLPPQVVVGKVNVVSYQESQYSSQYVVKKGGKKFDISGNYEWQVGDIVYLDAVVLPYRGQTQPFGFNLATYKRSNNIVGKLTINDYEVVGHHHTIRILDTIRNSSLPLIQVLSPNKLDFQGSGVFLFSIGTALIYSLVMLLKKFLFYLNVSNLIQDIFEVALLFGLFIISGHQVVLYLLIATLLKNLDERLNSPFNMLDLKCLGLMLTMVFMPKVLWSDSFIIFALTLILLEITPQSTVGILVMPLIIMPFMVKWHNSINLTWLLVGGLFYLGIKKNLGYLLVVISIIPIISLEQLGGFFNIVYDFFETTVGINIKMGNFNLFMLLVYGGFFLYLLLAQTRTKTFLRFAIMLLALSLTIIIDSGIVRNEVVFLDVGQGDTSIIKYNHKTIVIDAYGEIVDYLTRQGTKTIDYLIITHGDYDHSKEAQNIINNFSVKTLIVSRYSPSQLSHPNQIAIGSDNLMTLEDVNIRFLAPLFNSQSTNENSLAFIFEMDSFKFMFTGDITTKVEQLILDQDIDVDVLSVAHHGSNTSSSQEFLQATSPAFSIISSGENNWYRLPSNVVLERFWQLGLMVLNTSQTGSIIIKTNPRRLKVILAYQPYSKQTHKYTLYKV